MKKLLVSISIMILASLIFLFWAFTSENISLTPTGNTINKEIQDPTDENQKINDEKVSQTRSQNDAPEDAGESAAGGTESLDDPSYLEDPDENGCISDSVSYTIGSFQENSVCVEYSDSNCIRKTTTCSVHLSNLDDEISGDFTLEFRFSNVKDKSILTTNSESQYLLANGNANFESSAEFLNDEALLEITCSINVLQTPEIEICTPQPEPPESE